MYRYLEDWLTDSAITKTTAEAVGITNINEDVATALSQDLEYRIHEIIQVLILSVLLIFSCAWDSSLT